MTTLTHDPDHHNGDCIYCNGFSYTPSWWLEPCAARAEFERRQILNKPDVIRKQIAQLQLDLQKAEDEAAKVRAKPPK